jgi:hypothetical protein
MLRDGSISLLFILAGVALNFAGMSIFMVGIHESSPASFLPLVVWVLTVASIASLCLGLFIRLRRPS